MVIRVRPSVRRALRVVIPILIVVAAWTVWTNVERRRLERAYGSIVQLEMALSSEVPSTIPDAEQRADSYYAAAAVAAIAQAASNRSEQDQVLMRQGSLVRRQRQALAGGPPLTASEASARDLFLARNSLVIDLVERASPLRFHTFPDGEAIGVRFRGLPAAARSEAMRTVHLLAAGDVSGAALSIEARLRFLRALRGDVAQKAIEAIEVATDIGFLLSSPRVGDIDLTGLDRALSEVYAESEFRALLFRLARARYDITLSAGQPFRPVAIHIGVAEQKTIAEAVEAARLPWPQRLTAMESLREGMLNLDRPGRSSDVKPLLQRLVPLMADGIGAISAAQTAVAVERYRQRTGSLPETLGSLESDQRGAVNDPYSSEPLRYKMTVNSFVVYSVGSNRRDDGGNLAEDPSRIPAKGVGPTFDVGVEVKR
jgi:hypothetical protein